MKIKNEAISPIFLAKNIEKKIFLIRGLRIILSYDLAELYQVKTKALIQAVKRNSLRFPEDFMFQLSQEETDFISRSQIVTLKKGQNLKYLPYAFTEQGVAMLSGILRSPTAVLVNIEIMRAFVRFRELLASNETLLRKVNNLEMKFESHDKKIYQVFQLIRELLNPNQKSKRPIGIRIKD